MPLRYPLSLRVLSIALAVLLVFPVLIAPRSARAQDATPVAGSPLVGVPDLLDSCDSIFGVVILDADGNVLLEHNPDLPFVSASLYKLVLIAEIFARVEDGELSLTDTLPILPEYFTQENGADSYFIYDSIGYEAPLDELLYATGAYSSNVSALALLTLTTPQRLEQFADELGLDNTRYWLLLGDVGYLYPESEATSVDGEYARSIAFVDSYAGADHVNVTTPRDMATFFRKLSTDTLISPLVSWRVKQVLTARVINDRLPALLPSTTTVIHKTGNLYGVLHDAGYIETAAGPMVVVAMAQAVTDYNTTFMVEQRLGLLAYELGRGGAPVPVPEATPGVVSSAGDGRRAGVALGRGRVFAIIRS